MTLLPLSLSIAIVAGIFTYVAAISNILIWPAFIGWAIFFFAGGTKEAIVKAIPPMISGVILGYLSILAFSSLEGNTMTLVILVSVIAFVMTFMMNISAFSLAPVAFASCAAYFGAGDPIKAGIPLLIGLFLGYVSVSIPNALTSKKGASEVSK